MLDAVVCNIPMGKEVLRGSKKVSKTKVLTWLGLGMGSIFRYNYDVLTRPESNDILSTPGAQFMWIFGSDFPQKNPAINTTPMRGLGC